MPKRLLFIRFSSIGDIVLTSAAIRCAKQQIPGAEIHFLTKRSLRAVSEANPYIDHFHYLEDDLTAIIKELKLIPFHAVIDLHNNQRTWRIKKALGVKSYSYNKLSLRKILLTTLGINTLPHTHVVKRYLDTLRVLCVEYDGKGLDYFIPIHTQLANHPLPITHQKGYVALVIGASYFNKKLPLVKLLELCAAISHPIVLIGDENDAVIGEELTKSDPQKIVNACGKYSINESALLIKESKYVVSHDTGFLHIAAAFNKPTITIWGATTPVLQFEAFYAEDSTVPRFNAIVPGLSCQPCTKQGSGACPKQHFNCMMQQDVKAIAARIEF